MHPSSGHDSSPDETPRADPPPPLVAWLALAVAVVAFFAPVLETAVYVGVSDFKWHARAADQWARGGAPPTPHFLFQALLIAIAPLLPGADATRRAVLLALGCQAALAVALTALLYRAVPLARPRARFAGSAALALALMVAAPVTILSWSARNLYHGYVGLAVYHNPTLLLLKPFAVLLWWETARALGGVARPAALLASLTVLSSFAKPSLLIALLPAAAVLALALASRGRTPAWRSLLLGLALPAALALGWQFAFRYGGAVSVEWAPLRAMAYQDAHLAARLLLSALFPVTVVALFPRAIARDVGLALAAATFTVGAGYAYLLAESGDSLAHRNFAWSAQAALFVLFVAAARTSLTAARQGGPQARWRAVVCGLALALHVACGLYFYAHPTWW